MILLLASMGLAVAQETPAPEPAPTAAEPAPSQSDTLSFDERVVKGQVAAGSVYLFQRKPRVLPGLVPVRRSYRTAIIEPLLGERTRKPTP
ncbi:MAG: hypothetical protein AAF602_31765 [Myxococcota bacterium]